MNAPIFAGIDVGGTNIKIGLIDTEGTVIAQEKFPTQPKDHSDIALQESNRRIIAMLESCGIALHDLAGIGLATPGPMDAAHGKLLTPFNLPGWHHQEVRDAMQTISGKPVAFANDVDAAGFGEYWLGAGKQYSSVVMIALGTGVGGGIIIDDQMIAGAHGHGAEVGHMIVDPSEDARLCSCGKRGHLEAYSSATALVKNVRQKLEAGSSSVLQDIYKQAPESLTPVDVFKAAQQDDQLALRTISDVAFHLGTGVVAIAHIIDPEAVLLGGAMSFGGNESPIGANFVEQIRNRVRNCSLPGIGSQLTIDFSVLGSDAGFIGAAGLAKKQHDATLQTQQ